MELSAAEYYKQLSPKEVSELLGVGKTTIWKYVKEGIIPEPRYPAPKQPKWKLGEIIEVYEAHLSGADDVVEGRGLARAQAPKKETTVKPQSTAEKLKKRFGLS